MRPILLSAAAMVAALLGCGDDDANSNGAVPATSAPPVELRLAHRDGAGGAARAMLRCDGDGARVGGYLARQDPRRLCRAARRLRRFLASRPDPERICTQIYGGPDTARVRGTIGRDRIDRRFSRVDGCAIADYDRMVRAGLLPKLRG